MPKLNFILDFETFGQDPITCPIINCAMYVFDWDRFTSDNPYTFEELTGEIFQLRVSVTDQIRTHGLKIAKKDLDWWSEQGPSAQEAIRPSPNDLSLEQFLDSTIDYVRSQRDGRNLQRWWSRANCFDPVIIQRVAQMLGKRQQLDDALPYWLVRDTRTYIDTRFNFQNKKNLFCPEDDDKAWDKKFVLHNSIHDVAADILRIQKIERIINA